MAKLHQVSVVAIFRNEHNYIEEWVKYHLKVGVDHFYLYDNGGDHEEILKPFSEHITYTLWTDDIAESRIGSSEYSRQTMAYTDCVEAYTQETEWLQLIDLDEYLVPYDAQNIKESLSKFDSKSIGKLRVPRYNFGNNRHLKPSKDGSITSFFRRERWSSHHKDMGSVSQIQKVNGPHSFRSEGKTVVPSNLKVHHHYTRTLGEWLDRARTGGGQTGKGFRVFLGQRKWLAYLTFFVLNLRSIYVLIFLLGFNLALWLSSNAHPLLFLLNIPIVGFGIFSFLRGQNEVRDRRAIELMD